MTAPQLSVIIPAFNEASRLPGYLEQVMAYLEKRNSGYEIIVVDDGSSDATANLVEAFAENCSCLQLIRLPENRGKGAAVRTGVLAARGRLRLFADADGATPIAELERLEKAVERGADIAVASRAVREGTTVQGTFHRELMGTVFNMIVQTLAVPGIRDTQCGFKLFTDRAASLTFPLQRIEDFGFDVEVLFLARKQGLRIDEVPVNWTDIAGTKVRVGRDSMRMLADIAAIRWNELSGNYRRPVKGRSGESSRI